LFYTFSSSDAGRRYIEPEPQAGDSRRDKSPAQETERSTDEVSNLLWFRIVII